MVRNVVHLALTLVLVFPLPVFVSAQTGTQFCPLDGYLAGSFTREAAIVAAAEQPLVLQFAVANDSVTYSYGGAVVGVALYESALAAVPAYWAPVLVDALFVADSEQRLEVELDVSQVPAGEYVARLGIAQGGQLAAIANSQSQAGIIVSKTVEGQLYPTALDRQSDSAVIGQVVSYELTTENTSDQVLRDYDQHVAIVRGDVPLGSAVVAEVAEPVKMIPGASERTTVSELIATDGTFTVFGFSTQLDTFLPVVAEQFLIGEEAGPGDAYIAAVGIESLTQADADVVEVVACVAPVAANSFDVMQIEQTISDGDTVLNRTVGEVNDGGFVATRVAKDALGEFTIDSKLYSPSGQISEASTDPEAPVPEVEGILEQTVTQTIDCSKDCQQPTVSEAFESFAADETVQSTVWFYLGIILAAFLLMVLMIGRLTPPEEEEHEPMHEPE